MEREKILPASQMPQGAVAINRQSVSDKLRAYLKNLFRSARSYWCCLRRRSPWAQSCGCSVYTLVQGVPNLSARLFEWEYTTENQSMLPALLNTLFIAGTGVAVAVPLGVFAAIFMVEYAKSNNVFVKIVRMAAETLAGIPSIVYRPFGMLFFSTVVRLGHFRSLGRAHDGADDPAARHAHPRKRR